MLKPSISVVIPAYNVEAYIAETLDSLLAQQVAIAEIVIINDGSTDGTLSVLERHYAIFPQIKVFTQPNRGVREARMEGLRRATGEYVLFCDPDDFIHSELILQAMPRCAN